MGARTTPPTAVPRRTFSHQERLVQIAVEVFGQIRRQAVDHPAQLEQRILGCLSCERTNCSTHGLGFRPASLARPILELLEVGVLEIDLERNGHDTVTYRIMIR